MQIWEAFAVAGGAIVSFVAVWTAISKLVVPALKARDKFKKVDGIDDLRHDSELYGLRIGKLEGYQIKNYESIQRIEFNVDLIGRGMLSLIDNRLVGNTPESVEELHAVKKEMEARRSFK